jgi:small-conductance mechanosensitive channel
LAAAAAFLLNPRRDHCAALFLQGWIVCCLFVFAVGTARAAAVTQNAPGSSADSAPSTAEEPNSGAAKPVPLSEVATETEAASARVRELTSELSSDRTVQAVTQQLPLLVREIDARRSESRKIVRQRPSVEMLSSLEQNWHQLRRELGRWTADLASRATQLEREIAQADALNVTWQQTLEAAQKSNAPPETIRRTEALIVAIKEARAAIAKERARTLAIQTRVAMQQDSIDDALRAIASARADIFNSLLVKDSPVIWGREVRAYGTKELQTEIGTSLEAQWVTLRGYAERQPARFLIQLLLFTILATLLGFIRGRLRQQPATADPQFATPILEMPVAAALILSLLASGWIYPQAPRLLWTVVGALALFPSIMFIRRLIGRRLYPIVYLLLGLYLLDQVRTLAAAVPLVPRIVLLAEIAGGMLFFAWFVRHSDWAQRFSSAKSPVNNPAKLASFIVLAICGISIIANIFGYVNLSTLLGNAVLRSAYLALILYAAVEVLDGMMAIALRSRFLSLFGAVNRHRLLLHRRVRRSLQWVAIFIWVLFALDRLLLREPLLKTIRTALQSELAIGSLRVSLEDVVGFGLTVWAAFLLSRFVRFLLEEEVYPRARLRHGLPYAISTMLNYVILLVGFFVAMAVLGLDMTKVTILVGAFSVGVGLGLQNIVSNFVAGVILLFERPVNVGDIVQIDDAVGVVERIGIRASIIRTMNGSGIIVPNGKLISDRVVNWTLSNRQHGIELPISVAQDTDPKRVVALLEHTAAAHPLVTDEPPPQALVVKLGPDALGLELRAWTERIDHWMQIRSELAIAIRAALARENIAIR